MNHPDLTPVQRLDSPWERAALLASAHLIALGNTEMVPEATIDDVLGTVQVVRSGGGTADSVRGLLDSFDQRVEALVPASAIGVLAVGRGTGESIAAMARLQVRDELLALANAAILTRSRFAEMAERHSVTMMAATLHGQPATPTTLGHWLGGVLSPLSSI